jgi:hypothetical protein
MAARAASCACGVSSSATPPVAGFFARRFAVLASALDGAMPTEATSDAQGLAKTSKLKHMSLTPYVFVVLCPRHHI